MTETKATKVHARGSLFVVAHAEERVIAVWESTDGVARPMRRVRANTWEFEDVVAAFRDAL